MGKNLKLDYNGEFGYAAGIEDVVENTFKIYGLTAEQFLDYVWETDSKIQISNREIAYDFYSINQRIRLGLADKDGNDTKDFRSVTAKMPCPLCSFNIDSGYVSSNEIINSSSLLTDDFSVKVFSEDGKGGDGTIFENNLFFKNYISFIKGLDKNTNKNSDISKTRRQYVHPKVWIWCKSLNENGVFNPNSIFNLTPFIESVKTNVTDTGGNFNLSLINIEGFIKIKNGEPIGVWSPRKDRYIKFKHNNKFNFAFKNVLNGRFNKKDKFPDYEPDTNINGDDDITKTPDTNLKEVLVLGKESEKTVSSDLFFKNLISANDVIFITFRDDEELLDNSCEDFFQSNQDLPYADWDMIGLIDTNSDSVTYEGDSFGANISGRDCMKLLIEDNSNFFANSYSDNGNSVFENFKLPSRGDGVNASNNINSNAEKGKRTANRLITTGQIDVLYNQSNRNVHFVMNLLISRLSNISVCHDRLFEYYGDRKTKYKVAQLELVKKNDKK